MSPTLMGYLHQVPHHVHPISQCIVIASMELELELECMRAHDGIAIQQTSARRP